MRVDTGVGAGSRVPPDFDSLVAKVIASGASREEARARLVQELRDFELVIAGGATNKSFLIDLLESPDFRAGSIDTAWLDRRPRSVAASAVPALVAAAILLYQDARRTARMNFFADPTNASAARAPASNGLDIDLVYEGQAYRIGVLALGSWRYRLLLDGAAVTASLLEHGSHGARLLLAGLELRILHDLTDAAMRIEVDGEAHRFARQAAGTVTAGSPAVVVAVHVKPGDRVASGQPLGVLEAMKMEIAFRSPLAGRVVEVKVRKGQQVAAGEALLVLEPEGGVSEQAHRGSRLRLPPESDRPEIDEVRGLFLGYDCDGGRAASILALLESADGGGELATLALALATFTLVFLSTEILLDRLYILDRSFRLVAFWGYVAVASAGLSFAFALAARPISDLYAARLVERHHP
ncbi:MAG: biotin/lipoyl-containing protein, partial [Candidatus Binatia bacterium]